MYAPTYTHTLVCLFLVWKIQGNLALFIYLYDTTLTGMMHRVTRIDVPSLSDSRAPTHTFCLFVWEIQGGLSFFIITYCCIPVLLLSVSVCTSNILRYPYEKKKNSPLGGAIVSDLLSSVHLRMFRTSGCVCTWGSDDHRTYLYLCIRTTFSSPSSPLFSVFWNRV